MEEVIREHETIGLIREMIRFLSQEPLLTEDVAARVGSVTDDPGGLASIIIRPDLAGVEAARLMRDPDSGLPFALKLEFAPAARPAVKDLKEAFGDYDRALTDRGRPAEIFFYPPAAGTRWKVVLVAALAPGAGTIDESSAAGITLRRDSIQL